jgi:DNA-binding NtrC family response regulator
MTGQPTRPHATHEVLVVDPDDDIRRCLVLYLRMRGVRTLGTSGAHDTLERLRKGFRPCVVFVDPRRVGLAAWEIVDYLRADSVLASVPLVLVAGEPLLVRSAQWRGIRECVEKPAAPPAFVEAIERQCRRGWLHRIGRPQTAPAIVRPTPVRRVSARVAGAGRRG